MYSTLYELYGNDAEIFSATLLSDVHLKSRKSDESLSETEADLAARDQTRTHTGN